MKTSKITYLLLLITLLLLIGCTNSNSDKTNHAKDTSKTNNVSVKKISKAKEERNEVEKLLQQEKYLDAYDKLKLILNSIENDEQKEKKQLDALHTKVNKKVASLYTGEFYNNGNTLQINTKAKNDHSFDIEGKIINDEFEDYFSIDVPDLNEKSGLFVRQGRNKNSEKDTSLLLSDKGIEFYVIDETSSGGQFYKFTFEEKLDDNFSNINKPTRKETEVVEQSDNVEEFNYTTYYNTRFGFSLEHPTTFIEDGIPENNDGRGFVNEEASIDAVGRHINMLQDNETIETYYNGELESIDSEIAYQRLGDDWYVISYSDGNNIVYKKGIIGENIISELTITYPVNKQDYYEPMVTRVADSFIGGTVG